MPGEGAREGAPHGSSGLSRGGVSRDGGGPAVPCGGAFTVGCTRSRMQAEAWSTMATDGATDGATCALMFAAHLDIRARRDSSSCCCCRQRGIDIAGRSAVFAGDLGEVSGKALGLAGKCGRSRLPPSFWTLRSFWRRFWNQICTCRGVTFSWLAIFSRAITSGNGPPSSELK